MTQAVILAAGIGRRFDNTPFHYPKALIPLIHGQTILAFQLEALAHFFSPTQIRVVLGYQKEKIVQQFATLSYVINPLFAQENTAKSLLRGLNGVEEDLLFLNGDVVFHWTVVEKLLQKNRTAMIVNREEVGEEEVKYRTDGQEKILEVSKHLLKPEGEALGINYIQRADLSLFKKKLEACSHQDYFERGIELAIEEGMRIWAEPVAEGMCVEIDFPEDLVRANQLIQGWHCM